jgi:phosphoribosylaminoimidazole-succinocarboxamide synthase
VRDPRLHFGLGLEGICRVGTLAGEKLEAGLLESQKFAEPVFSPATKAETGHDENITIARMREIIGEEDAFTLESMTRAVYTQGEEIAREAGIIIGDTKFEFGKEGRRSHHPDRRGDDPGQLPFLGRRRL